MNCPSHSAAGRSRTIADLAGSDTVTHEHVFEAVQYRSMDRNLRR
jgi:predicted ATPase with chaperone activity